MTDAPNRLACCRRIDVIGHAPNTPRITWCSLPEHGPETMCSGVVPKQIEMEPTGPTGGRAWAPRRRW